MCSKQETLELLALNYIYHILSQYVSGTITEKVAEKIQHPESVHPGSKTLFLSRTGMVHTLTQQLLLHVQYWNQFTPDTVLVWMGQKFISPTHSPEGVSQ